MRDDCLKSLIPTNFGVFATVIVIFTYNVLLDKDVQCTCKPQKTQCDLYIALPPFIIFFLVFWMDKTFQTTWKYLCTCKFTLFCKCFLFPLKFTRCSYGLCCVLFHHIVKAILVGLVWVASVLIDGDWYVCCQNDHTEAKLACKDNKTAEEKAVIAELRNYSKVFGFSTLFCLIFIGTLMSMFDWRRCCEEHRTCCDRKVLYQTLILEEEEGILEDNLRKSAKEQLIKVMNEEIQKENWQECFNVGETLMGRNPKPREPTTTAGETANSPQPRDAPSAVQVTAVEGYEKSAKETDPLLRKGRQRV